MKIIVISQRGRKRDFVDLYWYCKNRDSLKNVIDSAIAHYPNQTLSLSHVLKSIMYFADADDDPMPKLSFDATWPQMKKYFQTEVPRLAREILGIR